jgi:hypothetical protein
VAGTLGLMLGTGVGGEDPRPPVPAAPESDRVTKDLGAVALLWPVSFPVTAAGVSVVKLCVTFLRYTANTEALQELLQFLYAECCTRNKAVKPQNVVQLCK